MSSFSRFRPAFPALSRTGALALAAAAALATSACTVRPLYQDVSSSIAPAGATASTGLATVSVKPVDGTKLIYRRAAQELRNHLIFGLNGGAGEPAAPRYLLDLFVTSRIISAAKIQIAVDNEPTAGSAIVTAKYRLLDMATGRAVAAGTRSATASFDKSRQIFATVRAEDDAENRAARELAEILRLSLAQDLIRLSAL